MSGLENVPASKLKLVHVSPERVPVSRVTVRVEVSRPEPASAPSPSEKVRELDAKYGADAPVSVIVWPVGAPESTAIVIPSELALPALSVAVTVCAPGPFAPDVHE